MINIGYHGWQIPIRNHKQCLIWHSKTSLSYERYLSGQSLRTLLGFVTLISLVREYCGVPFPFIPCFSPILCSDKSIPRICLFGRGTNKKFSGEPIGNCQTPKPKSLLGRELITSINNQERTLWASFRLACYRLRTNVLIHSDMHLIFC